jgi:hypothetical protein
MTTILGKIMAFKFIKDIFNRSDVSDVSVEEEMEYSSGLDMVMDDYRFFMFMEDQTPEMCMAAVEQNGLALQYVKDQTDEICMEAVKQNGRALRNIKELSHEICGRIVSIISPEHTKYLASILEIKRHAAELQYIEERKFVC